MKIEDLTLKLGADEIPWRLFTPESADKKYCVLWLQGWTSSMDSHREGVERMANKTNTMFATLDYAGHGLHNLPLEKSTRKQQLEEVVAIFDELKKLGIEKIVVIGGSFGAYMAALLVGKRPAYTVVLRAPANYPDNEFELPHNQTLRWVDFEQYKKTKVNEDHLKNTSATKAIEDFSGFVYVLEHELDEAVPSYMPKGYFEAAEKGNYLIIPKTKHSPKLMKDPRPHFDYIEHFVVSIIDAIRMQESLGSE